jgi:hypothetical protein
MGYMEIVRPEVIVQAKEISIHHRDTEYTEGGEISSIERETTLNERTPPSPQAIPMMFSVTSVPQR